MRKIFELVCLGLIIVAQWSANASEQGDENKNFYTQVTTSNYSTPPPVSPSQLQIFYQPVPERGYNITRHWLDFERYFPEFKVGNTKTPFTRSIGTWRDRIHQMHWDPNAGQVDVDSFNTSVDFPPEFDHQLSISLGSACVTADMNGTKYVVYHGLFLFKREGIDGARSNALAGYETQYLSGDYTYQVRAGYGTSSRFGFVYQIMYLEHGAPSNRDEPMIVMTAEKSKVFDILKLNQNPNCFVYYEIQSTYLAPLICDCETRPASATLAGTDGYNGTAQCGDLRGLTKAPYGSFPGAVQERMYFVEAQGNLRRLDVFSRAKDEEASITTIIGLQKYAPPHVVLDVVVHPLNPHQLLLLTSYHMTMWDTFAAVNTLGPNPYQLILYDATKNTWREWATGLVVSAPPTDLRSDTFLNMSRPTVQHGATPKYPVSLAIDLKWGSILVGNAFAEIGSLCCLWFDEKVKLNISRTETKLATDPTRTKSFSEQITTLTPTTLKPASTTERPAVTTTSTLASTTDLSTSTPKATTTYSMSTTTATTVPSTSSEPPLLTTQPTAETVITRLETTTNTEITATTSGSTTSTTQSPSTTLASKMSTIAIPSTTTPEATTTLLSTTAESSPAPSTLSTRVPGWWSKRTTSTMLSTTVALTTQTATATTIDSRAPLTTPVPNPNFDGGNGGIQDGSVVNQGGESLNQNDGGAASKDTENNDSSFPWWILAVVVGAVLLSLVVFFVYRRFKSVSISMSMQANGGEDDDAFYDPIRHNQNFVNRDEDAAELAERRPNFNELGSSLLRSTESVSSTTGIRPATKPSFGLTALAAAGSGTAALTSTTALNPLQVGLSAQARKKSTESSSGEGKSRIIDEMMDTL